jgi:hypothetical protein
VLSSGSSFYVTDPPAVQSEAAEESGSESSSTQTRASVRTQPLSFNEYSSGLMSSGSFNFVVFSDFDNDGEYDVGFGAEDATNIDDTKSGLYAFTGNGGTAWTNASAGLWRGNDWAGIDLVDADEDGYMEYYATDESHGTNNNSGVKVWEYRSGSWTDSPTHVTTPLKSGRPLNVLLINISGDSRLDMVVCNNSDKQRRAEGYCRVRLQRRSEQ